MSDDNTNKEFLPVTKNIQPVKRNTLTLKEAWEEVFEKTISLDKLYSEVRQGRLPHTKIGSKILFRRDTLNAFFREQEANNYSATTIQK